MSYEKVNFVDHIVQNPDKYTLQDNADGTVTIVPTYVSNPLEVIQQGTPLNAFNLDKLDKQIKDTEEARVAHQADHMRIELSTSPPSNPNIKTYWYEDLGESIEFGGGGGLIFANGSFSGDDEIWFDENV